MCKFNRELGRCVDETAKKLPGGVGVRAPGQIVVLQFRCKHNLKNKKQDERNTTQWVGVGQNGPCLRLQLCSPG